MKQSISHLHTAKIDYTIERKCGVAEVGGACDESRSDGQWMKTCTHQCDSDTCNSGNEVELLFSQMDDDYPDVPRRWYCYQYDSADDPSYTGDEVFTGENRGE